MKRLFVLLVVVAAAFSQTLPSILNSNGTHEPFTAKAIGSLRSTNQDYFPNLVPFRNEFIAYFGPSASVGILRRNATGGYNFVSKWDTPVITGDSYLYRGHLSANNDGWISLTMRAGSAITTTYLFLLQIADEGTIIQVQTPTLPSEVLFEASHFHSDGSLISVSSYSLTSPAKSAALHRFRLANGNWTLKDSFTIAEQLRTAANIDLEVKFLSPIFHLTDTVFVAADTERVFIYELSTDTSSWIWPIKSSFLASGINSIAWNGNDAIMAGSGKESGQIWLFAKSENGTWSYTASMTGTPEIGRFGYTIFSLNTDTFLVSAQKKIFLVQRRSGTWAVTGVIEPVVDQYYFGTTLAVTGQHLLIDGTYDLHAVPLCMFDPIDYACPSVVELESCNFGDFKADIVCTTPSSPECTSFVSTIVTRQFFANDTIYFDFEMQRFGTSPRQATVGVMCGKSSSPSTGPSTAPSTSPSAAPKKSENVTSGCESDRSLDKLGLLAFLLFLAW